MNSVSSKKQNTNIDSPKTPGGISRSLLTPCRRVGLSRRFNKKGSSPFISPLSNSINSPEVTLKKEQKKRKSCMSEDELELLPKSSQNDMLCTPGTSVYECSPSNISKTPSRNILLSKKKSRTLLVMKDVEDTENILCNKAESAIKSIKESPNVKDTHLSKLARSNSKRKIKQIDIQHQTNIQSNESIKYADKIDNFNISSEHKNDNRDKSPNKLTKECIVVIQKKMLKNLNCSEPTNKQSTTVLDKNTNSTSQTLFDSDSDDMPLCNRSKRENIYKIQDDDDFVENDNVIVKKKQNKITSNKGLKISNNYRHTQQIKPKTVEIKVSQSSFDDDDDFECVKKNTIIVKKSYDKVSKPLKAKSTGMEPVDLAQKDIDELKARIEMKKKLLIAKAMTEDTVELRNLIKKWQKGCQEALFELFDLMRHKFPERQNMDYLEILQTLKIPPELVGYDVENDCFVTPDDSSIILSSIHT